MDHKTKDPKHIFLNKDKCNKNAKGSVLLLGFVEGLFDTCFVFLLDNLDINESNKLHIFKDEHMVSQVVYINLSSDFKSSSKNVLCK